ncbi:MAG: ATP-binding protein [Bacteroidota bacterium]
MSKQKIFENYKKYRFEFRHLTVLFIVLVMFQIILSVIQKSSLENFLNQTQNWYQKDSAEKLANLSTTSLELLLENIDVNGKQGFEEERIIQSFNIIFTQQLLQQNVEEICLILSSNNSLITISDGEELYKFLSHRNNYIGKIDSTYIHAVSIYERKSEQIEEREEIYSELENEQTFHIFVPFIPNGEFLGVFYMKNTPDFNYLSKEIASSYDEGTIIFSSLILLGLLAMYFISSYTVKDRDEALKQYFLEHEAFLKEQIIHEKESMFTKRIYHTHHKAEKVMGFIKEDLRRLSPENIEETKYRVTKYSNFISRVIYDMKWYDPPVQTIRNQLFKTNLNEVIEFIIKFLFLRTSSRSEVFDFITSLDKAMPVVHINEFVVWEILEPLIQNSIDHAGNENIKISLSTKYFPEEKMSKVFIADNGKGFEKELLERDGSGVKKIFAESTSTKEIVKSNSGYGCYIAYQIAKIRCGWQIDAYNNEHGCTFELTINH